MAEQKLNQLFEKFLKKESLFENKSVLQSQYVPEELNHRDDQINQIAAILAPALKNNKPSNLFVYGKTGTGKTVALKYVSQKLTEVAKQQEIPLKILYLNCKLKRVADTEYRLIAQLARMLGRQIPITGLPTDEVYNTFFELVEEEQANIILVLDEIDQLINKAGDDIIYNLTRINADLQKSQITIVGISNDLVFADNLDPRVKSSLSEEEIVFPPYNALQIQTILHARAQKAFKVGSITQGVIQKCAAYAAREHGDARRALELLRVAAEVAERGETEQVLIEHVDVAEEKIERDRLVELVRTQPKQFQATLYSIFTLQEKQKLSKPTERQKIHTGDVYDIYREICKRINLRPLTQRRISDILGELDMLGVINAKVISKGRYGRTREISLSLSQTIEPKVLDILKEDLVV
ncbi:MAG: ORC1-type DNA replication protein [Candidatus Woesearchaeota archaeon]